MARKNTDPIDTKSAEVKETAALAPEKAQSATRTSASTAKKAADKPAAAKKAADKAETAEKKPASTAKKNLYSQKARFHR